ncbi:hypothetical protein T11_13115 [Trichinella zimbabwensis]|uniref:Uncharacterized protein n=1 Tax=Trichinella zimbabwensis TaxID=268475 RepID=A0A0V1GEL7_9BILA|nr:hypothetical protein T11_9588 [Trichinella zimbabwensis]KRY96179.1 hypothetical protein T11_13115 [Trichinella zimbabwensis]
MSGASLSKNVSIAAAVHAEQADLCSKYSSERRVVMTMVTLSKNVSITAAVH